MALVIKFFKGVRNHWKKSTFAAFALAYGVKYTKEYYEIQQLMRQYCEKAAVYGKQPIASNENPRSVTVILNPNANKRKATSNFEKYCAPILNLAGICVDVVQTESEGHAKQLSEQLRNVDAVVVAGGDGTLSEVVTGLLRKSDLDKSELPIGVLPLGRCSTFGKSLFPGGQHLQHVRSLADAAFAVIEKCTKPIDVMKIEVLDIEDMQGKAVYAVSGIEWGAYRDAHARKDKYWYFGPLRNYVTYIFNGYKDSLNWNCRAILNYTLPCAGCTNCVRQSQMLSNMSTRWYSRLFLRRQQVQPQLPLKENSLCPEVHTKEITTLDLALQTTNSSPYLTEMPKLKLSLGPDSVNYFDFVAQGWRLENGQSRQAVESIDMKQVEIRPDRVSSEQNEMWYSIDKEDFEVKPVRITLVPKAVQMFCKQKKEEAVA